MLFKWLCLWKSYSKSFLFALVLHYYNSVYLYAVVLHVYDFKKRSLSHFGSRATVKIIEKAALKLLRAVQ